MYQYVRTIFGYECDMYGHLNNANYLHIYQEARACLLKELGLSIPLLAEKGISVYIKNLCMDFVIGVPNGMQAHITSEIISLSKVSSVWRQTFCDAAGLVYNTLELSAVFIKKNKPARIPIEIYHTLLNAVGQNE